MCKTVDINCKIMAIWLIEVNKICFPFSLKWVLKEILVKKIKQVGEKKH